MSGLSVFDGSTPSSRTVPLLAGTYQLSVEGGGSVTVSGTDVSAATPATATAPLAFEVAEINWHGADVTFNISGDVSAWFLTLISETLDHAQL